MLDRNNFIIEEIKKLICLFIYKIYLYNICIQNTIFHFNSKSINESLPIGIIKNSNMSLPNIIFNLCKLINNNISLYSSLYSNVGHK